MSGTLQVRPSAVRRLFAAPLAHLRSVRSAIPVADSVSGRLDNTPGLLRARTGSPLVFQPALFPSQVLHVQAVSLAARRVPEECSESVARLIARCLHDDPDTRPTAKELVGLLAQAAQEGMQGARPRTRQRSTVSAAVLPCLAVRSMGS